MLVQVYVDEHELVPGLTSEDPDAPPLAKWAFDVQAAVGEELQRQAKERSSRMRVERRVPAIDELNAFASHAPSELTEPWSSLWVVLDALYDRVRDEKDWHSNEGRHPRRNKTLDAILTHVQAAQDLCEKNVNVES